MSDFTPSEASVRLVKARMEAMQAADRQIARQQAETDHRRLVVGVSPDDASRRALEAARARLQAMPTTPQPVEEYRPLDGTAITAILASHPQDAVSWNTAPVLAYHPRTGQPIPADIAAQDPSGFLLRLGAGEPIDEETLRRVRWAPGRATWLAPPAS